ncbi:ABC transporter permease [Pseudolysinimonas sp.]|uniref:ABC transporter permease n=1 Tax=Pseudolysinimonas sp. TaxID=2680009 RepID=UPI00378432C2
MATTASHVERWRDEPLRSPSAPDSFWGGLAYATRGVWERRDLLGLLARRELKAKYKDSALGLLWGLARPLTQLVIYYVVIGQVLGAARAIPQFAIFVFAGLTAWGIFSESLSASTASIVNNSGLIKKVNLPRQIFPLSASIGTLFNVGIQFGILVLATIVLGQFPLSWNLLLLPLAFAVLWVFSLALGMILAAVNVYLRDLTHLVEVLLVILFWASPIVYSFPFVAQAAGGGWLVEAYLASPITLGVLGFEKAMWVAGADQVWPDMLELRLALALLGSLVLLLVAQRVFTKLEGNFAQEL